MPDISNLRSDALAIWRAGVDAVLAERLVRDALRCSRGELVVCGQKFTLSEIGRIAVVGAGKAGAGMAAAVEEALGPQLVDERVVGWVNVPADCVRSLRRIHLHAARPAGLNEPTAAGVEGAMRILDIVSSLDPRDLCLVLISGGGSALMPAPAEGVTLAEKQAVTRFLMQSGATISELNAVRTRLSRIKGGGLARNIRARHAVSLIISDVIGDPLDVIASGPTAVEMAPRGKTADALSVLRKFKAAPPAIPQAVFDFLNTAAPPSAPHVSVVNRIIGNNAMAIAAASKAATRMGYEVRSLGSDIAGESNAVGIMLAEQCLEFCSQAHARHAPICLVGGGETVVRLAAERERGLGGRNQQLVLAAVDHLEDGWPAGVALLSGGTDGEDGPTDAAGAFADADVVRQAAALGLHASAFLARNDAYHFFEQCGGLLKTGPTHTNVMDLHVAIVAP